MEVKGVRMLNFPHNGYLRRLFQGFKDAGG